MNVGARQNQKRIENYRLRSFFSQNSYSGLWDKNALSLLCLSFPGASVTKSCSYYRGNAASPRWVIHREADSAAIWLPGGVHVGWGVSEVRAAFGSTSVSTLSFTPDVAALVVIEDGT